MGKNERIAAYIDLGAVRHNMELMHEKVTSFAGGHEAARMVAVVKTDAYGHGASRIAEEIQGLDYLWGFAVATAEEAFSLRDAGINKPILILGYVFPEHYEKLIEEEVRLTLIREDQAEELSKAALALKKKALTHVAIDTGMGRIGWKSGSSSVEELLRISGLKGLSMEGIFTHFARADESDLGPAKRQLQLFNSFIAEVENRGLTFKLKHASNSAGIFRLGESHLDLVRCGITLYGLKPSDEVSADVEGIRPILELKSHIIYIKEVCPGDEISYGGTFRAERNMRVATIPAGYGDGYARTLSNKGQVLIRGRRASILGRICMDQFMADVTDIADAACGDEAVLIGSQGSERISMEELGTLSGRFNYEFACGINKRVPRVYINGSF